MTKDCLKFIKQRSVHRARRNPIFWRLLVGLLLFVGLAGSVEADLGIVVSNISGLPYAMVIDSSGRIVTAGTHSIFGGYWGFGLSRYNSDGSLDTTFGNAGLVDTDISAAGLGAEARDVAIDNLGRIIVAGISYPLPKSPCCFLILNPDFLVARYNSDGSLDTTFGNGGVVTTDIRGDGSYDQTRAVAVDSLGRIVVAGHTSTFVPPDTWYPPRMALARYSSDGSLDPTFGDGGIVTTDTRGSGSVINDVAIDGAGRIVV